MDCRLPLLFFLCTVLAISAAAPDPLGRLVDAGGYHVHLYCAGQGSPTVIIAGGGFSFDWGLVQPDVAKFTRVCTYDPSGTAWSDRPRKSNPTCTDRINELHAILRNSGIGTPYILVGFSIGGIIARLYARKYPAETAAMVLVDHAFAPSSSPAPAVSSALRDAPPVLLSAPPVTFGVEDDSNFAKLPGRDRDLHIWAMSKHPVRPGAETLTACMAEIDAATKEQPFPLGSTPLIVISTENDTPGYAELQSKLLALSRNSRQMIARESSHMVIIDQPEIIVAAIKRLVQQAR